MRIYTYSKQRNAYLPYGSLGISKTTILGLSIVHITAIECSSNDANKCDQASCTTYTFQSFLCHNFITMFVLKI